MSQSMRAQIGALILATSGVQLANGFFGTFISLRVALDFAGMTAALILSGYFAGFTLGALYCTGIIERFGHIRSYAAFADLAVAATAAMPPPHVERTADILTPQAATISQELPDT
jgi:hypothetical protein